MKTIKEMKTKLQAKKQDNKGFSLVELIIVIAIMAILVGIIASQVIPYMEKSRESKDISILDTCLTSLQTTLADNEVTVTTGTITGIDNIDSASSVLSPRKASLANVEDSFKELIGVGSDTDLDKQFASKKAGSGHVVLGVISTATGTSLYVEKGSLRVSSTDGASK